MTISGRTTSSYRKNAALAALLIAVCFSCAHAQGFPRGPKYAGVTASVKPAALKSGGSGALIVHVVIARAFHIQSAHPADPDLIATAFAASPTAGIKYGAPIYPKDRPVSTATGTVSAYAGTVDIVIPFHLKPGVKSGRLPLSGTLTYQGCNANSCFPPRQDRVTAVLTVN